MNERLRAYDAARTRIAVTPNAVFAAHIALNSMKQYEALTRVPRRALGGFQVFAELRMNGASGPDMHIV